MSKNLRRILTILLVLAMLCAAATAFAANADGLHLDEDNVWRLYLNGTFASGYTGLINDPNIGWWLVRGGIVATDYTGLYYDATFGTWLLGGGSIAFGYNGTWEDPTLGTVVIENGKPVENGSTAGNNQAAPSADGLHLDSDNVWRLYLNGEFASSYTGLINDPVIGWWLVQNGIVATNYTGLYNDANFGCWLLGGGAIAFGYNGTWDDPTLGTVVITDGKPAEGSGAESNPAAAAAPGADGLHLDSDNIWRLYLNGAFASGYTGLINDPNIGWWLVQNGIVATDYTGLYNDANFGCWLLGGGAIAFGYNGTWDDPTLGTVTIEGGKPAEGSPAASNPAAASSDGLHLDSDNIWRLYLDGAFASGYTGLFNDPTIGWWLVRSGIVATDYTGIYEDPNFGTWLIGGGAVAFDYNGEWDGHTIEGGKPTETAAAPIADGLHLDSDNIWRFYLNNAVASDYTGLVNDPTIGWWLVRDGVVAIDFTGVFNDPYVGWWLVRDGTIAFDYSGEWDEPNVGKYTVDGGHVEEAALDAVGDFGGAVVYIYDWWSNDDAQHSGRVSDPSETTQKQYDYEDEIEAANNVTVVRTALTDWSEMPAELMNIVANQDDSELRILGMSSGFAGEPLKNNLYMPWTYGLDMGVYDNATVKFMTKDGVCYGVPMSSTVEPRQGVFFNKRVLEEAGINWNELYDLQASGQWTWDKMEAYMNKVQRDTDNDGVNDIWGMTGNGDDVTLGLVVSNNADFYGYDENGKLTPTINTNEMKQAIETRYEWNQYMMPTESWDGYQTNWASGNVAFMVGQSYEGFNSGGTINNVADDWGFVAMPLGPNGDHYTSAADNNVFGIPNVYDEETSLKLQKLFTQWVMPTPGVDPDSWADGFYELTDERAIEETYAMLRKGENATIMNYNLLGDRNTTIGPDMLWYIGDGTAEELIESVEGKFEDRCKVYNGEMTEDEFDAKWNPPIEEDYYEGELSGDG